MILADEGENESKYSELREKFLVILKIKSAQQLAASGSKASPP